MSRSPRKPRDLCTVAREEADKVALESIRRHFTKQEVFVKGLVGDKFYSQCRYDGEKDKWIICERVFYYDRHDPSLVYHTGYSYLHIYTLAELGACFKLVDENDAKMKADKQNNAPPPRPSPMSLYAAPKPSWFRRLFSKSP